MTNKRERIVLAARELFRTKGVEKTKIADITRDAGIALGTFYLYFPSKFAIMPDIARQLVMRLVSLAQKDFAPDASFDDRLSHLVDTIFDCIGASRDVYSSLLTGLVSSGYSKEWEAIYKPFYTWMARFIAEYQQKGIIRPELDPVTASKLLLAIVEETAEQLFLFDTPSEDEVRQRRIALMDFVRHALMVNPKAPPHSL